MELAKPRARDRIRTKTLAEKFMYRDDRKKTRGEKSNQLIFNSKKKKESPNIGGGYFRDFGDVIPQRTPQDQTNREETGHENETGTSNQPQTIQKKRWQPSYPEHTPQYQFMNTATA